MLECGETVATVGQSIACSIAVKDGYGNAALVDAADVHISLSASEPIGELSPLSPGVGSAASSSFSFRYYAPTTAQMSGQNRTVQIVAMIGAAVMLGSPRTIVVMRSLCFSCVLLKSDLVMLSLTQMKRWQRIRR